MQAFHGERFSGTTTAMDPVTRQHVSVRYSGALDGTSAAAAPFDPVRTVASEEVRATIDNKLANHQVALVSLAQSMPHYVQEIVARSNHRLAAQGAQVTRMSVDVVIEGNAATPGGAAAHMPSADQMLAQNMTDTAKENLDPRNYEYQARVNVGGLNVDMSSESGLDTGSLKDQVKDKIKFKLIGCGIATLAVLIFVGAIGYLGWKSYAKTVEKMEESGAIASDGDAKGPSVVEWDGKKPFRCDGAKNIEIRGAKAAIAKGVAVTASGSCVLVLDDVDVKAGDTAVKALGKAQVTIKGGHIEGKKKALSVLGADAQILVEGAEIVGETSAVGGTIAGM